MMGDKNIFQTLCSQHLQVCLDECFAVPAVVGFVRAGSWWCESVSSAVCSCQSLQCGMMGSSEKSRG